MVTPVGTPGLHPDAEIDDGVSIGPRTTVWAHAHLRAGAVVGSDCVIGERSYIAGGVVIGNLCKINAMTYLCGGVTLEDGVLVAAGVVFTNERYPRAATNELDALRNGEAKEEILPTLVRRGVTIGAGAAIGCGLEIGEFATVGMGAVVTRSVPAHALVIGNPARQTAWVCRCGQPIQRVAIGARLPEQDLVCDRCGWTYKLDTEGLHLVRA